MSTTPGDHWRFSFGDFTLDVERGALIKGGVDVKLRPKSFAVLRLLVERHGCLVSRDELLDAVWAGTIVSEGSVAQCLIDVRRALDDHSQQIVRTVPRRGYIFDAPVSESSGSSAASSAVPALAAAPGPFRSRRALIAALTLIGVIGAASWLLASREDSVPAAERVMQARPNSIAVLPFSDMSPEQDQQYLSEGIAEEILNLLAKTPDLHVIARTSSFSFKGRNADIATIAARLNVAYVLEGSVRKSGDRVRITAQLIEAAGSSHRWSETYERDLQDAFQVQTEIAVAVAQALNATLVQDLAAARPAPASTRAHELYLQGLFFFNRRGPGDLQRAQDYFQGALRNDPGYARAWAALAGVYGAQVSVGSIAADVALPQWREAVERALALDPDLAEGHARASQYFQVMGDVHAGGEHLRKAAALEPENPLVLSFSANAAAWDGRLNEAVELTKRAVTRDPVSVSLRGMLSGYLLAAGRYEEAQAELREARELNPVQDTSREIMEGFILILQRRFDEALASAKHWPEGEDRDQALTLIYHALGRTEAAETSLGKLVASPGLSSSVRISEVYAHRGEFDEAFAWLDKAGSRMDRNTWLSPEWRWAWQLRFSPFLRPLHADPRWDAFVHD